MWRSVVLALLLMTGPLDGPLTPETSVNKPSLPGVATETAVDGSNQTADCRQRYPRTVGETDVNITVTRGPTEDSVRLQFPQKTPDGFDVVLPGNTTVLNHSGFSAVGEREFRAKQSWNHTLIYEFAETGVAANTSRERSPHPFEGAADWMLAPLPADYDKHRYETVNVSYTSPHQAAFGEEIVYIGDHETHTHSRGCHALELVVPDAVSMGMAPSEIFAQMTHLDKRLSANRYTQVTIFVSRENFTDIEGNARESDIVIAREAARQNMTAIWLHEYIHTRQAVYTRETMDWWTEATAEYLAGRLLLERGDISPRQYNRYLEAHVQHSPDGVILADPQTWRNDSTYSRGFVVLAALDARIRNTTNGSSTFLDVFRRVNQQDRIIGLSAFVHLLEQTTGTSWEHWTARYIAGAEQPPVATVETTGSKDIAYHTGSILVLVLLLVYALVLTRSEDKGE